MPSQPFPSTWNHKEKYGNVSFGSGGNSWYAFCPRAWGTKWNGGQDMNMSMKDAKTLVYKFNTAWSPPLQWLHVSWPSSNLERDVTYFEGVLGGTKVNQPLLTMLKETAR